MPHRRKELKIEGPNLWYLVGLITSDGCLSSDGRHIDITSKERDFLRSLKDHFHFVGRVCNKYNSIGQLNHHIILSNRSLYEFLLSIGLSPRKSLTIKAVDVPEKYFCDFLRGLIDGDGCIRSWMHPSNKREQWSLRIYSGSERFIKWLKQSIETLLRVKGKIHKEKTTIWILKYGKMAARIIAQRCYYEGAFALNRKGKLARACANAYKGWRQSRTVLK